MPSQSAELGMRVIWWRLQGSHAGQRVLDRILNETA